MATKIDNKMTTTKKKYVKPEITVIKIDSEQIICASPTTYSRDEADAMEAPYWTDEFE